MYIIVILKTGLNNSNYVVSRTPFTIKARVRVRTAAWASFIKRYPLPVHCDVRTIPYQLEDVDIGSPLMPRSHFHCETVLLLTVLPHTFKTQQLIFERKTFKVYFCCQTFAVFLIPYKSHMLIAGILEMYLKTQPKVSLTAFYFVRQC